MNEDQRPVVSARITVRREDLLKALQTKRQHLEQEYQKAVEAYPAVFQVYLATVQQAQKELLDDLLRVTNETQLSRVLNNGIGGYIIRGKGAPKPELDTVALDRAIQTLSLGCEETLVFYEEDAFFKLAYTAPEEK